MIGNKAGGKRQKAGLVFALLTACLSVAPAAFAQSTHLLIVVGLAGDPEHGELFKKWGTTLAETASQKLGVDKANVILLADAAATRDAVAKAIEALASKAGVEDTVVIVLFGHGTFAANVAKFNLPGPDMSPQDFVPLLARLRSKRVVFVNTASASGPFIQALSGPGRVIVTATRTGDEKYATLFGGPFVDALSTEAADADRDGKVSILEAFDYAKKAVAASYVREGLLPTEHALLDDNGDRQGSMDPGSQAKDGQSAAVLSLGSMRPQTLPVDEKLRALYVERQQLERRIESLKLLKSGMDPEKYASELEKLATALALKSRQIREADGKGK
ncbi:MAG TPA: C13 family peptidase [Vicinamibacterales bacterium]